MDLRRLNYFLAVAEEQHFGRAAARLHMTAPPLSQRIRELEAELGVQLFERTSRRVRLTEAGERLLGEARGVIKAAERFSSAADALRATTISDHQLTLAYCHGSEHVALTVARLFRDRHPDIAVRPSAFTSLRTFNDLRAGRVTVGIVRPPVPHRDRLAVRHLATVPFDHLAIPEGHRLAALDTVHAAELSGESVLLVERDDAPTYHDDTINYCAALGVTPRWVLHPASQVERMLDMVAVGSGIGWLNAWQAGTVRGDGVVIRALVPVQRFDEFHLVWHIDDDSLAVSEFLDIAAEVCAT